MAYNFNLQGAINKIAELEDAITTPTPGVVTAYGYNLNPIEITNPALLPAVVHVPLGPNNANPNAYQGRFDISYDIYSRLLIIEAIPNQYPGDEGAANLFWKSVVETFFNYTNQNALIAAASADDYMCILPEQSYQPRTWPPIPGSNHWYWSLQYVHRFTFEGG